jgi:hypothetical protein
MGIFGGDVLIYEAIVLGGFSENGRESEKFVL